jgi:hypothetical protein
MREVIGMDAGPGLAIPYLGAVHSDGTPYVRVRLDEPYPMRGDHSARYLTRKRERPRLYLPPLLPDTWQQDAKLRLLITEGEKKALAACQAGFACLGLAGVWAWLMRRGDTSVPLPEFDRIAWTGRRVVVVGDSDLRVNTQAVAGLERLRAELARRGARARVLVLPERGRQ